MAEADTQKTDVTDGSGDDNQVEENQDSKSFSQEQVDGIVKARMERFEKKAQEDRDKAIAEALADAERKAKLTAEERATEESTQQRKKLEEMERDISLRENRADAREALQEKNISTELVELIVDVDAEKQEQKLEKLESAFTKAVEEGVTAKLKGTPPEDYSGGDTKKKADSVNKGGTTAF